MSATFSTKGAESEVSAGTLGALLYADQAKARIPEQQWVDLVRAVAARDQLALRALYERTHRIAFTLIMRITHNRETAEELTLDVFHDVWRRAAEYDTTGGTVLGWIMNQARSRAIDRWRFERRQKRAPLGVQEGTSAELGNDESEQQFHRKQQRGLLEEALQLLTPDERNSIETTYFSELTYAEAAVKLDQPLGTVKTRIRTGLAKLREAFGGVEAP